MKLKLTIACRDAKTPASLFEGGCRRSDRGSRFSKYAINLDYILSITLIFIVGNRGLQGIASILLLSTAIAAFPLKEAHRYRFFVG
ncbi:hypothetical protein ccbrp13_47330 [Ktedonobacteria bacterium brp13]|nr:hypothetical protein ccbrp13_47330 [Ktedonobacteria bacterium brp13]